MEELKNDNKMPTLPVPPRIVEDNKLNNQKLLDVTKKFIITKGMRYFGEAAMGLTNQLNNPKYKSMGVNVKSISAGIEGEKATSKVLKEWIKNKPNAILIDSIHLRPDTPEEEFDEETGEINILGDTDHLIIIANKIILIDSKNWKEKTTYTVSENQVLRNKKPFKGNSPKMRQAKYLWKKFYQDYNIDIECFVCISNPNTIIMRDREWWSADYKFVNHKTLTYFLDELYNEEELGNEKNNYINIELIAKAITGLQKPYVPILENHPDFFKMVKKGL